MKAETERNNPQSTADHLVVDIRRKIFTGQLVPGQRFSLRALATELGVSFIPVREALRTLESQGFVIADPGRRSVVAPLEPDDLRSIYRIRLRLEPEMAFRSCELLTPDDFDRLAEQITQFSNESKNIDDIYDSHHDFHLQLLKPAATDWDMRILENLWHAAERYVRLAFGKRDFTPGEHQRREVSHRELLETFRARDPERAAFALREHLVANERLAEQSLAEILEGSEPAKMKVPAAE